MLRLIEIYHKEIDAQLQALLKVLLYEYVFILIIQAGVHFRGVVDNFACVFAQF